MYCRHFSISHSDSKREDPDDSHRDGDHGDPVATGLIDSLARPVKRRGLPGSPEN